MKKLTQTRQKLIINRQRKSQTPQKLQIQVRNGAAAMDQAHRLKTSGINITKLNISSIINKQNFSKSEKKGHNHRGLMKCRSISFVQLCQKSKNKAIPLMPAVIPKSEEKSSLPSNRDETVLQASRSILAKMKERGAVSIRNHYYTIHHEDLLDLIAESFERANPQSNKNHKSNLSQTSQIKAAPCGTLNEGLQIFTQYSFKQAYQKVRNICHHSRVVDQHHVFEEYETNEEAIWRIANTQAFEKPTKQNVQFLLSKTKHLQQEANQRQVLVRELSNTIEELNRDISNKQKSIEAIQSKRVECLRYLQEIQETAKQMETFIDRQPNRILLQQAKQYKQREQELFDLAYLYEQQNHSSVPNFIYQSIMVPLESFKLTIQSFPRDFPNAEDSYSISKKCMDKFKASIKSAFESTVEKLSAIIERKTNKIKNFVSIMRRLASYTIGKREYLGEINKKMAVASIQVDKSFRSLEDQLAGQSPAGSLVASIEGLRQLFQSIKTIYCEAEVFY